MSMFNVKTLNSARPNEILTACFLSKFLFNDKCLMVGDKPKQADITALDNSFAIEVVSCELEGVRNYKIIKDNHDWKKEPMLFGGYSADNKQIQSKFSEELNKKISKLNNRDYKNSSENIYLAIDSMAGCFDIGDTKEALSVYYDLTTKYKSNFKAAIFLNRQNIVITENTIERLVHEFYIKQANNHEHDSEYFILSGKVEKQFNISLSDYYR